MKLKNLDSGWAHSKMVSEYQKNKHDKQHGYPDTVWWPKKKKWPCKRGKGEHDFQVKEVRLCDFFFGGVRVWYDFECSVCGKKDYLTIRMSLTMMQLMKVLDEL